MQETLTRAASGRAVSGTAGASGGWVLYRGPLHPVFQAYLVDFGLVFFFAVAFLWLGFLLGTSADLFAAINDACLLAAVGMELVLILLFARVVVRALCLRGQGYLKAVLRTRAAVTDKGLVLPWLWRQERVLYPDNLVPYGDVRRLNFETANPVKHTRPKIRVEVQLPADVVAAVRRSVFGERPGGRTTIVPPDHVPAAGAGSFIGLSVPAGKAEWIAEALRDAARREGVTILSIVVPPQRPGRNDILVLEGPSEPRLRELLVRLPGSRATRPSLLPDAETRSALRRAGVRADRRPAADTPGAPSPQAGATSLVHTYAPEDVGDLEAFYNAALPHLPGRCKRLDWSWAQGVKEARKQPFHVLGEQRGRTPATRRRKVG